MLNLEQLLSFTTTVKVGSFSKAARELGKAQSTISQNIINMEIDCNQILFNRTGRYPQLTEAGMNLLPYALAVVEQHNRLEMQLEALGVNESKKVTIALDEGAPYTQLAALLPQLVNNYPQLQLEVLIANSHDVLELVSNDRAQVGVVFSQHLQPNKMNSENIGSIKFEAYVSSQHPLAGSVQFTKDSLKLHRQLKIESKNNENKFRQLPISPDIWYADNYYVLLEMAKASLGWTILPAPIAKSAVEEGKLVPLVLEHEHLGWVENVDIIQNVGVIDNVFTSIREILKSMIMQDCS
ncbi:LysR family transcriptional regulator [Vibrio sp. Isolate33]|uniref:LysR family transcriptional regulator n=1 Tax=Vibrio TaxID=662 RepID=UPI001EFC5ED5|nr:MULTISPECIES: LysR family transcriptional regulator [Vibrio]MCG9543115.1 LysR family transcriptional regulator [Vibrio sp. Isolate33]